MTLQRAIRIGLAAGLALAAPGARAAEVELGGGKASLSASVDVGGQKASVRGSPQKFNEYRDVRDGFLLNELSLDGAGPGEGSFLSIRTRNATRTDESYRVELGRYGGYRLGAAFERFPHNFSRGRFILSGAGTRNLAVDPAAQAAAQAGDQTRDARDNAPNPDATDPNFDTTGGDAVQQGVLRGLLNTAESKSFGLDREKGSAWLEVAPLRDSKAWLKVTDERRKGFRQISAGTYERYAQGAAALTHIQDRFMVSGMQLAEPLDYRTTLLNLGAGVYKREWSADLEYTFTKFEDEGTALIWANPFRNTDASAQNSDSTRESAGDNGFDRGRFARGQLGLPPTSVSNELAGSASVELPWRGRFTATAGVGLTDQHSPLNPYTLNSDVANTLTGPPAQAPANITSVTALPQRRYKGAVRTVHQSYLVSLKPTERLGAKLKYRFYDYENRSGILVFPGYAAFGESFWRTAKNDFGALVTPERPSYLRQTGELGAEYELFDPLSLSAEAFWDKWDYRDMRIDKTEELGAGGGFRHHCGHLATLHGRYRVAHRTSTGYSRGGIAANPEANGLINYNWADRVRHRGDLGLTVTPAQSLSVGLSGQLQKDDLGVRNRFGLKTQHLALASVDVAWEPLEWLTLSADYSREYRRSAMRSGAKDNAFNDTPSIDDGALAADSFNPLNYWNTTITENVDAVGVEARLRPREALELDAGYSLSDSRMDFLNTNPNSDQAVALTNANGQGVKLTNAAARAWPSVVNRTHAFRAGAACRLAKDVRVGLRYRFEYYTLEDFANQAAYLAGLSPENSTRFVFTDANSFDYRAHVVGTYVAWRF